MQMARKKKKRPTQIYDSFYCAIDDWQRVYHFGAKVPERKYDESGYGEWDRILITTNIRHHITNRPNRRRKFEAVEIWLSPDHKLRSNWSKDAKDIGGIFPDQGLLRVYVDLPSDVFYSLIPCLAINHFKEISLSAWNLRYSHGDIRSIGFEAKETPSEDRY
jgi:hypothetical protein